MKSIYPISSNSALSRRDTYLFKESRLQEIHANHCREIYRKVKLSLDYSGMYHVNNNLNGLIHIL